MLGISTIPRPSPPRPVEREPRPEAVRLEALADRAEPRVRPVEVREDERAERDEPVRAEVSRVEAVAEDAVPAGFAARPHVSQYPSTTVPSQPSREHESATSAGPLSGAEDAPEAPAPLPAAGSVRAASPQLSQ